ncbi:hypothetical protein H6F86_29175 [Phormidium sp. FACHB-592]|uniref:Peptide O-xylosyltransferase n=1 Tax=Stenomitos frigidus AS-A4 TaxID=2933935 RepID=A0ABV0KDW5_9CYAN|nr:beta-1,6-N-acetylglucosaminyltransferase [Phormidium sp. FACHB-592]MBD2077889.1 hypothetical protein [Phormidium sp. FACHB-592]
MRIAYIVLVHQYPAQLVRLVHKLKTENTSFFIHIDRKAAPSIYHAIVNEIGNLPDVYLLKRHNCYWGELGHVNATIEGIKALLNSKTVFDYTVLVTGQCYPLKANSAIEMFLNAQQGFSLMEHFPLPSSWQWRIEKWHIRFFSKKFMVPKRQSNLSIKRRFPSGLEPFCGSAYWCLSRECIEYIDKFLHHNHNFINFFRFSFAPDEMFFQTILLNSPLKHTIINDNYWYIKWLPAAANPIVLGVADFETMTTSSKLFARKFDATQDPEILDRLDRAQ